MKKNTLVTGKMIAERTRKGHPSTEPLLIYCFAMDNNRAAIRIRNKLQQGLNEK